MEKELPDEDGLWVELWRGQEYRVNDIKIDPSGKVWKTFNTNDRNKWLTADPGRWKKVDLPDFDEPKASIKRTSVPTHLWIEISAPEHAEELVEHLFKFDAENKNMTLRLVEGSIAEPLIEEVMRRTGEAVLNLDEHFDRSTGGQQAVRRRSAAEASRRQFAKNQKRS